jgi:hypothetical protein
MLLLLTVLSLRLSPPRAHPYSLLMAGRSTLDATNERIDRLIATRAGPQAYKMLQQPQLPSSQAADAKKESQLQPVQRRKQLGAVSSEDQLIRENAALKQDNDFLRGLGTPHARRRSLSLTLALLLLTNTHTILNNTHTLLHTPPCIHARSGSIRSRNEGVPGALSRTRDGTVARRRCSR